MNKIIVLAVLASYIQISLTAGQNIDIVSSSGGEYSTESGSLTFTLGELSNEMYTTREAILTEGVQQIFLPESITGLAVQYITNISIYPNPTSGFLAIHHPKIEEFSYLLIDQSGKEVLSGSVSHNKQDISINDLLPGVYILELRSGNNFVNHFRIIKN